MSPDRSTRDSTSGESALDPLDAAGQTETPTADADAELLIYADDFAAGVQFSIVGALGGFESLLTGGGVPADVAGDYTPVAIAYEYPAAPRYAVAFVPDEAAIDVEGTYAFVSSADYFLSEANLLEVGVRAGPQGDGTPAPDGRATSYEFGALVSGWRGRAPEAVEGEVNPTLELRAGQTYEVTWTNLDGLTHQFVVADESGEIVAQSALTSTDGETVSFTFTATESTARYYCSVHPEQMSGEIAIDGG